MKSFMIKILNCAVRYRIQDIYLVDFIILMLHL